MALLCDGFPKRIENRTIFRKELLSEGSCPSHQFRIGGFPFRFVGAAGLEMNAGTRTIDFHFPLGATAHRTDVCLFCRTESLGGTLGAERTARHRALSISGRKIRGRQEFACGIAIEQRLLEARRMRASATLRNRYCNVVIAVTSMMSATEQPRERSLAGFRKP